MLYNVILVATTSQALEELACRPLIAGEETAGITCASFTMYR